MGSGDWQKRALMRKLEEEEVLLLKEFGSN
jgi:hypothetical protein